METEKEKSSFAVPVAIIIAGAFIALSLYYSNSGKTQVVNTSSTTTQNSPNSLLTPILSADLTIRPVSASDHVLGNPNAPIVIVEYSDTECPFCKQFQTSLHKIMQTYGSDGSVAWVYRHFPLDSLHPKARSEAVATECAAKLGGNDKFWAYIDLIFQVTPSNNNLDPAELQKAASDVGLDLSAFNNCIANSDAESAIVQADSDEAVKAGANGTPFSIIVSAKKFDIKKMKDSLSAISDKYSLPTDLFVVSNDGMRIVVSGALPYDIMDEIVKLFKSLQ